MKKKKSSSKAMHKIKDFLSKIYSVVTRLKLATRKKVFGDLKIATAEFDNPASFIGKGWSFFPNGKDQQSHALVKANLNKAEFVHCIVRGRSSVKGKEKLSLLMKIGCIRYGATVFMGLWEDYQHKKECSVLEQLYIEKKITYVDFFGDIFLSPNNCHYVLSLHRDGDARWRWCMRLLDNDWTHRHLSVILRES